MSEEWHLQNLPLVSVSIVCNETTFLRETLESVLKQDYSNVEIIVVLNGKATNSKENLELEYKHSEKQVRFFVSLVEDIVTSRNLSIDNCSGELICIIDSDDLMPPKRIEAQVAEFHRNNRLVCVGGQLLELQEGVLNRFHQYPTSDSLTRHSLFRYSSLPQPGVMFLKSAVIQAGGYTNNFPWIEDWDLWMRLKNLGEIYNLSEPTVYYRRHVGQSTNVNRVEIDKNSRKLLLVNLNLVITGKLSGQEYAHSNFERKVYLNAFLCLLGIRRPKQREGLFGLRIVRRAFAGLQYNLYQTGSTSERRWSTLVNAILCVMLDPYFFVGRLSIKKI
jgi:glycosyltransferase involved in cell wall biosynthesis